MFQAASISGDGERREGGREGWRTPAPHATRGSRGPFVSVRFGLFCFVSRGRSGRLAKPGRLGGGNSEAPLFRRRPAIRHCLDDDGVGPSDGARALMHCQPASPG